MAKNSPAIKSRELFSEKLLNLFKKQNGKAPPFLGENFPYPTDPHWIEPLLFYEYFNPDTGKGLGASHQTGWTALIANLIADLRM